ncbi:MAG: hypothetical protein ACYS76_16865, partial [Planctomycetota bacterium]
MTVLGLITGGAAWRFLLRYRPRYTAQTYLKVLPPVERDPMTIVSPLVQKDIQYGYRASIAALIMQQSSLEKLIDSAKVQEETKWFQRFGDIRTEKNKCIRKAFKDLKKHFGAYPDRDREFVTVSMTCGKKNEAALIVNEMVGLFLNSQGTKEKEEIGNKLANLREQQRSVERGLRVADDALDEVRERYGITDLEQFTGRYFQHTVELKLNDLELEQN